MLIDTHAHMYLPQFDEDRDACMERAIREGLRLTLLPNIDAGSIGPIRAMRGRYPKQCLAMMGLHPCAVNQNYERELALIKEELFAGDYVAVGEIGLDYYWDTTYREFQKKAFRAQVRWAKELGLPIAIHTRDSFDDICELLEEEGAHGLRGVFHCFTGTEEAALRALSFPDFYLGIGGIVTFKNSDLLHTLQGIGLERVVLETDAPYLAPAPFRGKRNETAYTGTIAQYISTQLHMDLGEVIQVTGANAQKLFKLDAHAA